MCRGRNVEETDYMEKVTWKTETRGSCHVEERDCNVGEVTWAETLGEGLCDIWGKKITFMGVDCATEMPWGWWVSAQL